MKSQIILVLISLTLILASDHLPINQEAIANEINSMDTTWKAGVNEKFGTLSKEGVKSLLGALRMPEDMMLSVMKPEEILEDLPANFDLREAHPQCESLKEIRDQSTCGSCWAFGAAEAMSDRICIASNGKLQTRISTEQITAC